MRHTSHPLPLEARVQAAWQAQLVAAVQTPGLRDELVGRRHELLPRVAAVYTQLQALPRRVRRALQRQWQLPLATLALWLALGQLPVQAATIPVEGACTLVDAITAANTDTATGGCQAGSGADKIVLLAGSTHTLTQVNYSTYGRTGLPVIASVITIAGHGSTIARASGAPAFRLVAVNSTGDLTLQETTVSGGEMPAGRSGGGVANYGGTLTIRHSTISGNVASFGGGMANFGGTLTVANSTISGNYASSGGGVANFRVYGYGGVATLTLDRTLISGNYASDRGGGPEIYNGTDDTVVAHTYNLFGVDGTAGVAGFSPGASDIVPPAGVRLRDILEPTLADNGGPTKTHALVPGSPAIDAAGPVCLDANGNPLTTDQRRRPRPVDGDGDEIAACDIGAFEFQP
jgi:hypothetical protein